MKPFPYSQAAANRASTCGACPVWQYTHTATSSASANCQCTVRSKPTSCDCFHHDHSQPSGASQLSWKCGRVLLTAKEESEQVPSHTNSAHKHVQAVQTETHKTICTNPAGTTIIMYGAKARHPRQMRRTAPCYVTQLFPICCRTAPEPAQICYHAASALFFSSAHVHGLSTAVTATDRTVKPRHLSKTFAQ